VRLKLPIIIAAVVTVAISIPLAYKLYLTDNYQPRSALNMESEEFRDLRQQGKRASTMKNYSQAIAVYEAALKMRPDNAEVRNDLGYVYYEYALDQAGPNWPSWESDLTGRTPTEVSRELETALKLISSGYIHLTVDDKEGVKPATTKAKAANCQVYTTPWKEGAEIHILVGTTKEYLMRARDSFMAAIDIKDAYAPAFQNLGALWMKIGLRNVAVQNLERAYKLEPRNEDLARYLQQLQEQPNLITTYVGPAE